MIGTNDEKGRKWWALELLYEDGLANAHEIVYPEYSATGVFFPLPNEPGKRCAFPHELIVRASTEEISVLVPLLRKAIRTPTRIYDGSSEELRL